MIQQYARSPKLVEPSLFTQSARRSQKTFTACSLPTAGSNTSLFNFSGLPLGDTRLAPGDSPFTSLDAALLAPEIVAIICRSVLGTLRAISLLATSRALRTPRRLGLLHRRLLQATRLLLLLHTRRVLEAFLLLHARRVLDDVIILDRHHVRAVGSAGFKRRGVRIVEPNRRALAEADAPGTRHRCHQTVPLLLRESVHAEQGVLHELGRLHRRIGASSGSTVIMPISVRYARSLSMSLKL